MAATARLLACLLAYLLPFAVDSLRDIVYIRIYLFSGVGEAGVGNWRCSIRFRPVIVKLMTFGHHFYSGED